MGLPTPPTFPRSLPISAKAPPPPHPWVIEGGFVHVQGQIELYGLGNVDGPHLALRLPLDAHGVFIPICADGGPLRGVGLAHLHRRQTAVMVPDDSEEHAVEVWQTLFEVVRVAHIFNG